MPTFKRADNSVTEMALSLMKEFPTHQPLLDAKVKVDYVFAFADVDEKTGTPVNNALNCHGAKALGIARKIGLKDRSMGRGDAEISLDADWWEANDEAERRALLDHELHHIAVKTNRAGVIMTDDLGRPKVFLRPHDYQFGWFNIIAKRHGQNSLEVKQSNLILHESGQYYFPAFAEQMSKATRTQKLELGK